MHHLADVRCLLLVCTVSVTGFATKLETSVDNIGSVLFMKPVSTLAKHQTAFVPLLRPSSLTSVVASFGEFSASESVRRPVLRKALGISERQHPTVVPVNSQLEISAHIVAQSISSDRPLVHVLFHVAPVPPTASPSSAVPSTASTGTDTGRYCASAHVHTDGGTRRLSSSPCLLTARTVVCLAGVAVPSSWWHAERSENIQVLFSVTPANYSNGTSSASCSTERNETEPSTEFESRNFLATLSLAHSLLTYEELKEDRNVLVYVPQGSFYPGSRFRVPVKLQIDSDLRRFIVKVKARHGVRIVGAEARNASMWRINLDLSHKLHGAMVTAAATELHEGRPSDRVEDVFEWIFEVDEDTLGEDRGRIQIIVEYEMNSLHRDHHLSSKDVSHRNVENRITAHVDIQRDNTYAIVPVVKSTELINMAMLSGRMQTQAMRVYSVSHGGRLSDVTSQTTCHSGDEEALKVVEQCSWVYMDGSETHGSSSVTIITKYGRHTRFTFFEVWAPQIPVEVVLSDNVLGQIKGWKVSGRQTVQSRKTRGADFGILTHPGLLLQEDGISRKDESSNVCESRYQSAIVDVYASFTVADTSHSRYLVHQGAQLRVTDLVRAELRVADPTVATFNEGNVVIEGLHPGRTEVQVLSRSGQVVGSTEVVVTAERVGVDKLSVDVIAGLAITLSSASSDHPRTLIATVARSSQLTRKYQEALLSVSIQFDDGTSMPLHYFPTGDYSLNVDTLNNHVVAFGEAYSPDAPRIIAIGAGKGELLKVSLELSEVCQRKKPRPLAVTYTNVDIDFTRPGDVQSDAAPAMVLDSFGRSRAETSTRPDRKLALHLSLDDRRQIGTLPSELGIVGDKSMVQRKEVQQKHVGSENGRTQMSALEISMYTLLGVFCVAVVVFSVNCAIFVARFRQRKKALHGELEDKDDPENCAPDWVWIGRETLERNAINTACSEALMPEADFNGNNTPGSSAPVTSMAESSGNRSSGTSAVGGTSNRNSFVSTYKGSECSIQISANVPVPDCNANLVGDPPLTRVNRGVQTLPRSAKVAQSRPSQTVPHSGGSLTRPASSSQPAKPVVSEKPQLLTESSLDDDDDMSSLDSPRHQHLAAHGKMTRAETLRRLEEAVASGSSDIEWDCNELGVTYDQLMTYFDNLKESTA